MKARITSGLTIILMTYVITSLAQDPISVYKGCFKEYADCGAEDVTPSTTKTENQRLRLLPSLSTSSKLFVGGKEQFMRIDPSCTPSVQISNDIPWCNPRFSSFTCNGYNEHAANGGLACNNYIRVVEELTASNLLVCGTNLGEPRCYSFNNDCNIMQDGTALTTNQKCTDLVSTGAIVYNAHDINLSGSIETRNVAPSLWSENSTLGLIGDSIFYGSNIFETDARDGDTFVAKIPYIAANVGTANKPYNEENPIRTERNEQNIINKGANFVGRPYNYDNFVYVFFREEAHDARHSGKIVYSRIGRVCQIDANEGNTAVLKTFFKARLSVNFNFDTSYLKYFNDIHDVFPVPGPSSETYFYAVFQTPESAAAQSALALFRLSDINNVLDTSKFKSQPEDNLAYTDVDSPPPRPGNSADCQSNAPIGGTEDAFRRKNTLLYTPVTSYYPPDPTKKFPLLYANGERFTAVVVDERTDVTVEDDVIFVGTNSGQIWKVVYDSTGKKYEAIALWKSSDGSPVTGLGLLKPTGTTDVLLFGSTYNKVVKINLKHGKAQNGAQLEAIYKPYLTAGNFASPASQAPLILSKVVSETYCNGHQVRLFCRASVDPVHVASSADTNWKFTPATPAGSSEVTIVASKMGQYFDFRKLRSNVPDPASYLLIKTHPKTAGSYKCYVHTTADSNTELDSQTHTIGVQDCITPNYKANQATKSNCLKQDAEAKVTTFNSAYPMTKLEVATCSDGTCPWT